MKSLRNKSNGNESFILKALVALAVLLAVMAISACFGSSNISLSDIFAYVSGVNKSSLKESTITILGEIRFPRIIMSALVGGSLASIGAIMQGIFKNPMADPSVLGISSGSALGATIAIVAPNALP
ncbi:MAG TPA: iron chelate uptake ABC transporter family permease subunit, partial [Saccharofermentans sp.]|nr:iron chelate uptake ABC transporter family permease subunit [Saccharofermentans sp.]